MKRYRFVIALLCGSFACKSSESAELISFQQTGTPFEWRRQLTIAGDEVLLVFRGSQFDFTGESAVVFIRDGNRWKEIQRFPEVAFGYDISPHGGGLVVRLKRNQEVIAILAIPFASKNWTNIPWLPLDHRLLKSPNKAPEPTPMPVTPRAPSSTSRASHGRGSS